MPIRFATLQDVPALVELGRQMHAITRFHTLRFDGDQVRQALEAMLTKGQDKYVLFVAASSQGAVVGGLLAVLETHVFSRQLTASIMHYDVLPQHRMAGYGLRLLKAFEQWCKNRHVVEINFGINSGVDTERLGRFARKLGYLKTGENYVRTLSHGPP